MEVRRFDPAPARPKPSCSVSPLPRASVSSSVKLEAEWWKSLGRGCRGDLVEALRHPETREGMWAGRESWESGGEWRGPSLLVPQTLPGRTRCPHQS